MAAIEGYFEGKRNINHRCGKLTSHGKHHNGNPTSHNGNLHLFLTNSNNWPCQLYSTCISNDNSLNMFKLMIISTHHFNRFLIPLIWSTCWVTTSIPKITSHLSKDMPQSTNKTWVLPKKSGYPQFQWILIILSNCPMKIAMWNKTKLPLSARAIFLYSPSWRQLSPAGSTTSYPPSKPALRGTSRRWCASASAASSVRWSRCGTKGAGSGPAWRSPRGPPTARAGYGHTGTETWGVELPRFKWPGWDSKYSKDSGCRKWSEARLLLKLF